MGVIENQEKKDEICPLPTDPPRSDKSEADHPSSSVADVADPAEDNNAKKSKKKSSDTKMNFPTFVVNSSPVKSSTSMSTTMTTTFGGKKRRSSSSSGNFVSNDPYKAPEMSPEITLIEFISTSAAFHGVKKQDIKQLEWDILKVFSNNVMPANAAAWYMAKRRFYINNDWENQLLPFLLKKYPEKFLVRGQIVEFLDTYAKDVARKKMSYMINQGLFAYFSHKADEYGVYFFDPYYYENTEPFHANLRLACKSHIGHRSKLIPSFFNQYKNQFVFTQHCPCLVTITKSPTAIQISTTGIIVSMIDNAFGLIQFPSGKNGGTEKALFSAKALYTDGWRYNGDPLKLDAVQFDGYKINHPVKPQQDYTWYAVLVWSGRKPSPKFCANKDDLTINNRYSNRSNIPVVVKLEDDQAGILPVSPPKNPKVDDSMIIGEILEIKKNGAVVSMNKDSTSEKSFIPGWRRENLRKKGYFLTSTSGVGLSPKDLVGYYLDPHQTPSNPDYVGIAYNLIVLKHAPATEVDPSPAVGATLSSPNTRRQFSSWKMLNKFENVEEDDENYLPNSVEDDSGAESSNYDSFDEADEVSDGELNFLRDGISEIISENVNRDWKSIAFWQKVMQETNNAINTRNLRRGVMKNNRPITPNSHDSGVTSSREVTPNGPKTSKKNQEGFWRMKKAFKCLEKYNSDDDPSYEPSDSENESGNKKKEKRERNVSSTNEKSKSKADINTLVSTPVHPPLSEDHTSPYVYWLNHIMTDGIKYCPHRSKWIIDENVLHADDEDTEYIPPISDYDEESDDEIEIPEDEVKGLQEDLEKDPVGILTSNSPDETDETDEQKSSTEDKEKSSTDDKETSSTEDKEKSSTEDKDKPSTEDKEKSSSEDKDVKPAEEKKVMKNIRKPKSKSKMIPYWVKMILSMEPKVKKPEPPAADGDVPKSVDKIDEKPTEDDAVDADNDERKESEDEYDSDIDPEFYPGTYIMDEDVDYDEYSDGEIPQEEVEALKNESCKSLDEEFVGKCDCDYVEPPPSPKKNETEVEVSKDTVDDNLEKISEDKLSSSSTTNKSEELPVVKEEDLSEVVSPTDQDKKSPEKKSGSPKGKGGKKKNKN